MITALDTNVLLDLWVSDPAFGEKSRQAMMAADAQGSLVICEVVYAELSSRFTMQAALDRRLDELEIEVRPVTRPAAYAAGHAWARYRQSGGPRTRIMADFLIGAHAAVAADRFMTRDRGFYRGHFAKLVIVDPSLL